MTRLAQWNKRAHGRPTTHSPCGRPSRPIALRCRFVAAHCEKENKKYSHLKTVRFAVKFKFSRVAGIFLFLCSHSNAPAICSLDPFAVADLVGCLAFRLRRIAASMLLRPYLGLDLGLGFGAGLGYG